MDDAELVDVIERGVEQRHVEFKGRGSIDDKHFVNRVAKAILAMTNRQDGGYVIVGVEEGGGIFNPIGIDASDLGKWTRDTLADKMSPLVDPSVDFDLEHKLYDSRWFVLLTIREFDETPVFCRADRHDATGKELVLRDGALYVRSRRKPETIEIRTSQEMRDLLDIALAKRYRHFLSRADAFGLVSERRVSSEDATDDAERFRRQLLEIR